MPSPRASEVDKIRRELDESNRKAMRLDEALQERDHAMVQVKAEKQVAVHAKRQLDEDHAALVKLQEEVTRLQEPEGVAQAVATVKVGAPIEEVADLSPRLEPSRRSGNELVGTSRGGEEQVLPPPEPLVDEAIVEQESFDWSFCHWVMELDP
ncbi:uncharacterized protein A4U43_C03F11320 [Asparagus officinalis]|uniref:Uncharacterized protein n=1 Tax=Asparagus officinalis TaxID=4686 RepID=A0A5P1F985_ASPOF|nr:uncharacterized protein A4U43_C03F11320 [Asparagus officinalis]